MAFNLSDYQTVQDRIEIFRQKYPEGRIVNEIVMINEQQVVVKASIYLDATTMHPTCVDFAQETIGSTNINKSSFLENCTTSATGRAISLLAGEMSPKGKRPSREEMSKVQRSWLVEANAAFTNADIDKLRKLYAEAKASKASQDILDDIKMLADQLKG
jgi:hypothetical protein